MPLRMVGRKEEMLLWGGKGGVRWSFGVVKEMVVDVFLGVDDQVSVSHVDLGIQYYMFRSCI